MAPRGRALTDERHGQAHTGGQPGVPTGQALTSGKPCVPPGQGFADGQPGEPAERTQTGGETGEATEQAHTGGETGNPAEQAHTGGQPGVPTGQALTSGKPCVPQGQGFAYEQPDEPVERAQPGGETGVVSGQTQPDRQTAAEASIQPACHAFSLALPLERVLPAALTSAVDGRAYPVDPDFRTVLACLRRLEDPNRSDLEKRLYLAKRFFLAQPPRDMEALFLIFVTGGEASGADEPPLIHFERDAGAIYASFRQQYGIDLLRTQLHWVEFRELLAGLTEATPLGVRVRLRTLDESRLPPEERARVRRLREKIALTPPVSRREQALTDELNRRLAAGEDPAEIIRQLQEV